MDYSNKYPYVCLGNSKFVSRDMEQPLRIATPGETSGARAGSAGGGSGASTPGRDAHVTWDEETIARHDLERGTRQKIEEPNTPFHYYRGSALEREDRGDVSPARSLSGKEGQGLEVRLGQWRARLMQWS